MKQHLWQEEIALAYSLVEISLQPNHSNGLKPILQNTIKKSVKAQLQGKNEQFSD